LLHPFNQERDVVYTFSGYGKFFGHAERLPHFEILSRNERTESLKVKSRKDKGGRKTFRLLPFDF